MKINFLFSSFCFLTFFLEKFCFSIFHFSIFKIFRKCLTLIKIRIALWLVLPSIFYFIRCKVVQLDKIYIFILNQIHKIQWWRKMKIFQEHKCEKSIFFKWNLGCSNFISRVSKCLKNVWLNMPQEVLVNEKSFWKMPRNKCLEKTRKHWFFIFLSCSLSLITTKDLDKDIFKQFSKFLLSLAVKCCYEIFLYLECQYKKLNFRLDILHQPIIHHRHQNGISYNNFQLKLIMFA